MPTNINHRFIIAWSFVRLQRLVSLANDPRMDEKRRDRLKRRALNVRILLTFVRDRMGAVMTTHDRVIRTRLVENEDGTYRPDSIIETVDGAREFPEGKQFLDACDHADGVVNALVNGQSVSSESMRELTRHVDGLLPTDTDTEPVAVEEDVPLSGLSPRERNKLLWVAKAMCLVQWEPEWPDFKIADAVGIHKGTLSRSKVYQAAAAIAREPRTVKKGLITKNPETGQTDVEAYDDP